MEELIEVMAKALVEYPEEVVVVETVKGEEATIEPKVAPFDMSKVVGKRGRIVKAIRSVTKAATSREDKKVIIGTQ